MILSTLCNLCVTLCKVQFYKYFLKSTNEKYLLNKKKEANVLVTGLVENVKYNDKVQTSIF